MRKAFLITSCVLAASPVFAEPVKGEAELGFVQTSGNSETTNINARLKLLKETENWKHEANFGALGSSSEDQDTGEDETTAEKYTADFKSDRKLDDRSFLYGIATYEDDRFGGFEYQATIGVGYGYKVIADDSKTLTFEAGPGYRYNAVDTDDSIPEEDQDEATLRLAEKFDWKISETAELNQYIIVEGGDDNTITKAGISIKSKINSSLALKVGIDAKHTDEPGTVERNGMLEEADDLDTETYASITYSF